MTVQIVLTVPENDVTMSYNIREKRQRAEIAGTGNTKQYQ